MDDLKKSKNIIPYALIVILVLIIIILTGLLIGKKNDEKQTEIRPSIKHETGSPDHSSRLYSGASGSGKNFPVSQSASNPWPDPFDTNDPFQELGRMREYMNRLMTMAMTYGPPIAQTLSGGELYDFVPTVDLQETANAYIVKSDLPGLQKDKINVTVRGNIMTLQGVREVSSVQADDQSGFYTQERSYGSFSRTLTLPGPVDEANVKASYQDGVLTVTLPKISNDKSTQKVTVQ